MRFTLKENHAALYCSTVAEVPKFPEKAGFWLVDSEVSINLIGRYGTRTVGCPKNAEQMLFEDKKARNWQGSGSESFVHGRRHGDVDNKGDNLLQVLQQPALLFILLCHSNDQY